MPNPTVAQPVADMVPLSITTQRAPDLVPLPLLPRNETPDVRWRRAIGE